MDEPVVQVVKEVLEFLEKTGNAMISTGFPIAVKYVIADAIGSLVKGIVSTFGMIYMLFSIKNNMKYANDNDDWGVDGPSWTAIKVILGFISMVVLLPLLLTSGVFDAVKMLIAPEWYAIINIIELVK